MRILLISLLIFLVGCQTTEKIEYEKDNIFVFNLSNSGSMEPALSGGDVIYLNKDFPYDQLKEGDTIAFYDSEWGIKHGLLHRIHVLSKNEPKEWIIKGDNNISVDPYNLTEDNYVGKVIRVDFN